MSLNEQKIEAEIAKLLAETAKLNKETKWYELAMIVGFIIALQAAAKYLL